MSLQCGFFNSDNHDRKYYAEDLSSIFDGVIKDGVFDSIGELFATIPGVGMQVIVKSGKAWFDHTWSVNNSATPLTIAPSDTSLDRIDAIVLEVNHSEAVRANFVKVISGIPSANPKNPTLTNTDLIHQHPLAYVRVVKGSTAIKMENIKNVVGSSECPFVTGILDTVDIDDLFVTWEGQFNTWFENIKSQLTGDVAANLQKQIDERVKIVDKASDAEMFEGVNDTKWVTPKKVKDNVNDYIYEVGDIKTTMRDLKEPEWLPCGRVSVDGSKYPRLFNLLMRNGIATVSQERRAELFASGMPGYEYSTNYDVQVPGVVVGYNDTMADPDHSVVALTEYDITSGSHDIVYTGHTKAVILDSTGRFTSINFGDSNDGYTYGPFKKLNGAYYCLRVSIDNDDYVVTYQIVKSPDLVTWSVVHSITESGTGTVRGISWFFDMEYYQGKYYLYRIYSHETPNKQRLVVSASNDGITWVDGESLLDIKNQAILSLKDGLYFVNIAKKTINILHGQDLIFVGNYTDEEGTFKGVFPESEHAYHADWQGCKDGAGNIYWYNGTDKVSNPDGFGYHDADRNFTIFEKTGVSTYVARTIVADSTITVRDGQLVGLDYGAIYCSGDAVEGINIYVINNVHGNVRRVDSFGIYEYNRGTKMCLPCLGTKRRITFYTPIKYDTRSGYIAAIYKDLVTTTPASSSPEAKEFIRCDPVKL